MEPQNPAGPDDILITPNPMAPAPAAQSEQDKAKDSDGPKNPEKQGSEAFDQVMNQYAREDIEDTMNPGLNIQEYIMRLYKREEKELETLQAFENDPNLSEGQRANLEARMATLEYAQETRGIDAAYREAVQAAGGDESKVPEVIAEKYNQRQADLKEYRQAMQNSDEFKDMPQMQRMRDLEAELEETQGLEAKDKVKAQMAETMREVKQEIIKMGDEGMAKVISFAEKNQDLKVVGDSGLMRSIDIVKPKLEARMAAKAKAQGIAEEKDIGNADLTPGGKPDAGAVVANNDNDRDAAQTEVAATADTGEGRVDPVRLQGGQEVNAGGAMAQTTPDARGPEERGAGAGL